MRIEIERSGGFAGIIKRITLDTEQLPKEMAQKIESQFSNIRISNRSSYSTKSKTADCYHYKISAQAGKKIREIEFSEFDVNQELRKTVNYLINKIKT